MENTAVKYEPHIALFAEDEGYEICEMTLDDLSKVLNKGAYVTFEIGYNQGKILKVCIINKYPHANVNFLKDINELNRMTSFKRQQWSGKEMCYFLTHFFSSSNSAYVKGMIKTKTEIWDMKDCSQDSRMSFQLVEIKTTYENGGLIAAPAEIVYGLGASAKNEQAVENIYKAKGHPSDNLLIVHIYKQSQMDAFISTIPKETKKLMNAFWPGPIPFTLPLKQGYLCEKVTGRLNSIAIRMPSHPTGRTILEYADLPIAAPSTNIGRRTSLTTSQHVYNDLNGKIDGIVNGDQSEEGLESTVLDCTQFSFRITRSGSITQTMLNHVVPHSVI